MSAASLSLKIPATHYVGFQARENDTVPLGFMTPDGEDAAAVKRKATVDNWAKGYGYSSRKEHTMAPVTYDNKPMSGFKLRQNVRHGGGGWGGGDVKWRIEDPRGFELEITSTNLNRIIEISTIEKGEILEKCIWCREGNANVLVPVASEEYVAATANTERLSKSVSLTEVKTGDYIVLQGGMEGIYLGLFHTVNTRTGSDKSVVDFVEYSDKKKHMMFVKKGSPGISSHGGDMVFGAATFKVAEIKTPSSKVYTPAEAEALANQYLQDSQYSSTGYGSASAVVLKKQKATTFTYELISKTKEEILAHQGTYIVDNGSGVMGYGSAYYLKHYLDALKSGHSHYANYGKATIFDKVVFLTQGRFAISLVSTPSAGYWDRGRTEARSFIVDPSTAEYYLARAVGTSEAGTELILKL
jgi:hypothetical protein